MKCIKNNNTNEVQRVNDSEAQQKVSKGTHSFCAKKEWKQAKNA